MQNSVSHSKYVFVLICLAFQFNDKSKYELNEREKKHTIVIDSCEYTRNSESFTSHWGNLIVAFPSKIQSVFFLSFGR